MVQHPNNAPVSPWRHHQRAAAPSFSSGQRHSFGPFDRTQILPRVPAAPAPQPQRPAERAHPLEATQLVTSDAVSHSQAPFPLARSGRPGRRPSSSRLPMPGAPWSASSSEVAAPAAAPADFAGTVEQPAAAILRQIEEAEAARAQAAQRQAEQERAAQEQAKQEADARRQEQALQFEARQQQARQREAARKEQEREQERASARQMKQDFYSGFDS